MIASKILEYQRLTELIMMDLPKIEGKSFENETLFLDFNTWENCIFINCKLILKYGIFSLVNNEFHKCGFETPLGTPAGIVLQIDKMIKEAYEREHDLRERKKEEE